MPRIQIKPISVNQCWQGRRFKSPAYKDYEDEMLYSLPKLTVPKGKLILRLTVGFSSASSDLDNAIKPILDILQKKYGFNDKMVYGILADKADVRKGEEFIEFYLDEVE